jgi:hypothetical protein
MPSLVLIDILLLLLDLWEIIRDEVVGLWMQVSFFANVSHFFLDQRVHFHQFLHGGLTKTLCFTDGMSAKFFVM